MPYKYLLASILVLFFSYQVSGQQANRPNTKKIKIKLSDYVNSSYIEVRPLISGDGKTLYFSRRNHPENMGGVEDFQDLWVAKKNEHGEWQTATNPGEPINNNKINAIVSVSQDGKEAVLYNNYFGLIRWNEKPLTKFTQNENGWVEKKDIKIKNFYNDNNYVDFFYSYRHDVLLMAIERGGDENNQGQQDIYISQRENKDTWQTPVNLGAKINSDQSDFAPFLTPDGKGLFFVSSGQGGEGGNDIFFAKRTGKSWTKWSEAFNLGPVINSSGEETYFSVTDDFKTIYFESYSNGSKDRDIYRAGLPERFHPPYDLERLRKEVSEDLIAAQTSGNVDKSVSTIQGQNQNNDEPSPSSPTNNNKLNNKENERNVKPSQNVDVGRPLNAARDINSPGQAITRNNQSSKVKQYPESVNNTQKSSTSNSENITSNPELTKKIATTIPHVKIEEGSGMMRFEVLRNIYFDFNSTRLEASYHEKLNRIFRLLQEEKGLWVKIRGYTDAVGDPKINKRISQKRAQSVAEYLKSKGIPAERVQIAGHGEQNPLATNDDEMQGRELNRRVEISLVLPFR